MMSLDLKNKIVVVGLPHKIGHKAKPFLVDLGSSQKAFILSIIA
jgi:hypothetical protein